MKGLSYLWRMAGRRKAACLLILLFTMVATIFLLLYPGFIKSTRTRLKEAYESIEVTGWILNAESYEEPLIPGEQWKTLRSSGYFSESSAYNYFQFKLYQKDQLEAQAGRDADDAQKLWAMQRMLQQEDVQGKNGWMYAYDRFASCDQLIRIRDKITWLDGYDENCLEGDEHICIISDEFGYQPGDTIPFFASVTMEDMSEMCGIFRLKVAATYHGNITAFKAVMPITTYEELCSTATVAHQQMGDGMVWPFDLRSFVFTVKDNHQLDELKDYLVEQGLSEETGIRAAIDDRILKGTVAPIESNLALLEGLYAFFFVMIAAIGFFISFLLARGRKPEYAVMRMLGESRAQITIKALCEQFVLCLAGVMLGAAAVGLMEKNSFQLSICAVILLCYTLGAAVAVMLTVRVNVMDILRDKE